MKRTFLAVGIAVLVSMMAVPYGYNEPYGGFRLRVLLPFFLTPDWVPWDSNSSNWEILWPLFILQTVFVAVLGAVLVNLLPRRPKK